MVEEGIEQEFRTENRYEQVIGTNFRIISESAHPDTGLFPAVDVRINTPESEENHMRESWIRDYSMNIVEMVESSTSLKRIEHSNELIDRIDQFVVGNLTKTLDFLNQPRWVDRFKQEVVDRGSYTELSGDPPEVHMKQNGDECSWDQNQPEAWGEFLIAVGRARQSGIVRGYSDQQTEMIKTIAEYLVRIQPWRFNGAGMWEGLPVHSPSSRSSAVVVAKGLDSVSFLFQDNPFLQKKIDQTVERTMEFVKEDVNKDFTVPAGHPDGADLAMIVAMALPDSAKTELPFVQYVADNGAKLQIGVMPGAIRHIGDWYRRGELGEARWFMADPVLSLAYFREAKNEFAKGDMVKAKMYRDIAEGWLKQSLEISDHYGHYPELYPELFIPSDPKNPENMPRALVKNDGEKDVALVPIERSLLWNSALVMAASSKALEAKFFIEEHLAA